MLDSRWSGNLSDRSVASVREQRIKAPGGAEHKSVGDLLDQSDIDALLDAVDSGEIEEETAPSQLFSRHRHDLDEIEIRAYDFKRPERVSKEQMRALETLHESFSRVFGASLSGYLRTITEVTVASAEQMTYSEFISSLPNPTLFTLVQCDPLEGMICLELSPLIVYPIIDRLLGGSNQELFIPQRPMTAIESQLMTVIMNRALEALTEAWAGVHQIDFSLGDMESNPQLVQIVPPNEVVVVIAFEIKISNRAGTMNLGIPFTVIEPLMDKLSSQNWFNVQRGKDDVECSQRVAGRLASAVLSVSGVLAETTITLDDLTQLSEGDLIVTDKHIDQPIVLCVEGERKMLARIGQYRGKRALQVIRPIRPDDRV